MYRILAYGGAAIDIGLATYGYNVMRSLGNHLTHHTPSRGFSMELGNSLTILTASFIGLPVSSTQCITGATAGLFFITVLWWVTNQPQLSESLPRSPSRVSTGTSWHSVSCHGLLLCLLQVSSRFVSCRCSSMHPRCLSRRGRFLLSSN